MRYCPHCGEQVAEEDSFCFECGTALDGPGPGKGESLRTVGAAAVVSAIGLVESLVFIFFPETILEQAEEFGLEEGLSETFLLVTGGFGLVLALGLIGLSYYYYSEGYVEKRFFWILIIAGFIGFLLASMVSFLVLVVLGVYGLWKVVE